MGYQTPLTLKVLGLSETIFIILLAFEVNKTWQLWHNGEWEEPTMKVMVHYCMKPEHDILLQCVLNTAEMFGFGMGGMLKCCLEQNSVIFQF